MNDHLTPPDHPLEPAARERIRQRVLTGLEDRPSGGRWLVPAGAVAAVAAIAVIGAAVASGGDDTAAVAPAGQAPSATSEPTSEPAPEPTSGPTEPAATRIETACRPELTLRGADQVVTFTNDVATSAFFSTGDRWQLCTKHADIVTVQADESVKRGAGPETVEPYRLSTDTAELADGSLQTSFTAAGVLYGDPADYVSIVYYFPGGDEVTAVTVAGGDGTTFWVMDHTPTDGPLADPTRNQTELPEIEVEVTYTDGTTRAFDLVWGLDTCAQINHGC